MVGVAGLSPVALAPAPAPVTVGNPPDKPSGLLACSGGRSWEDLGAPTRGDADGGRKQDLLPSEHPPWPHVTPSPLGSVIRLFLAWPSPRCSVRVVPCCWNRRLDICWTGSRTASCVTGPGWAIWWVAARPGALALFSAAVSFHLVGFVGNATHCVCWTDWLCR